MAKQFIGQFIEKKFSGKVDKAGKPYVCHLNSVAMSVLDTYFDFDETFLDELEATALLHDIFEDTDATEVEVRNLIGVDDKVIEALWVLTRSKDDTYMDYIEKVSKNEIATIVKLADLKHNMDITRYDTLDDGVFSLLKRYHKAYKHLIDLTKGNNYERI